MAIGFASLATVLAALPFAWRRRWWRHIPVSLLVLACLLPIGLYHVFFVLKANNRATVSALELSVCELDSITVHCEWNNDDILLRSECNKLGVIIENKVVDGCSSPGCR